MQTKDAQDFTNKNKSFGAIIKTSYESNANIKNTSLTAYEVFDSNFGIVANISKVDANNYEDANNNEQIASAYENKDYFIKFSLLNKNNNDLRLTLNQTQNSVDSQWKGTDSVPKPKDLEEITSTTTNYALQHSFKKSDLLNLHTNINFSEIVLKREEKNKSYSSKLKAESSNRYELGYKYDFYDTFNQNDYLGLDINVFKTELKDLILARDNKQGTGEGGRALIDIYNNKEDFDTKGFEINLFYNYEKYSSSMSYSYINTKEIDDNSIGLNEVDESIAIRRIGAYDSQKLSFSNYYDLLPNLNLTYTLNATKGIIKPISRPGFVTHDINIKYTPSNYSKWTLFAGIDNFTNKAYANHTTIASRNDANNYRYEMGRNFKVSARYCF